MPLESEEPGLIEAMQEELQRLRQPLYGDTADISKSPIVDLEAYFRQALEEAGTGTTRKLDVAKQVEFLKFYAACGQVATAAAMADVSYNAVTKLQKTDEKFGDMVKHAKECYADLLEAEARRRAVEGVAVPKFNKDQLLMYVREYSDTLLAMLLRAERPAKFRDFAVSNDEFRGGVLVVPNQMSADEWEQSHGAGEDAAVAGVQEAQGEPAPQPQGGAPLPGRRAPTAGAEGPGEGLSRPAAMRRRP